MADLLRLLLKPFIALDSIVALVAAIWLAIEGEWWVLISGVMGYVVSGFLWWAVVPGRWLLAPAAALTRNGKLLPVIPFVVLANLYAYFVINVWCSVTIRSVMETGDPRWPLLFWAYCISTGAWTVIVYDKQELAGFQVSAISTHIAYIAAIILGMLINPVVAAIAYVLIQLVGFLIQCWLSVVVLRERHDEEISSATFGAFD